MKLILFVVISCLALHNGKGAPSTATYKFVKCNPEGDQTNCVTFQSPRMALTPDLPAKLPASTAQYLKTKPVEEEGPDRSDDGLFPFEEGSSEGSAAEGPFMEDQASLTFLSETGSGESDTEESKAEDMWGKRSLEGEAQPAEQELQEDYLLQL